MHSCVTLSCDEGWGYVGLAALLDGMRMKLRWAASLDGMRMQLCRAASLDGMRMQLR
jgi:hypothetical protein